MEESNTVFKSFNLTGDARQAAESMLELTHEIKEEMSALRDEFNRRYEEAMARNNLAAKALWRRVIKDVPEAEANETWLDGSWYIENSFLKDHGVAFLCRREQEETPLAAVAGTKPPGTLH